MKRRTLLQSAGILTVMTTAGGVWRASAQGVDSVGEGPAYEPWHNWRSDSPSGPLALVQAGILACNPHNTQPWLFRITSGQIELYAATTRNLGSFDPYLREMHIGLGCAVENMLLAAKPNGYSVELTLPAGNLTMLPQRQQPELVARLTLSPSEPSADALYEQIPLRHTNRGPYQLDKKPDETTLQELSKLAVEDPAIRLFLYSEQQMLKTFGNLVVSATQTIIDDATMVADSEHWFRHSWADVQRLRDGVTLDTSGLPPLMTAIAKMLPPPSADTNHRYWLEGTRDVHVATAPVFGLLAVSDLYDRPQSLRAGQLWQRMHLWATAQGLAMQPLNQPVELVDRQRQLEQPPSAAKSLAELTGSPEWKPTFAFRLGYAQRQAQLSPRRNPQSVLL